MADGNTRPISSEPASDEIACLGALERQVRWLASWMIDHANHSRRKRDGQHGNRRWPGLVYFEPAYADDHAVGFRASAKPDGASVYRRLSTRALPQIKREMTPVLARNVVEGAYWVVPPGRDCQLVLAYCGVVAIEACAVALRDRAGR